MKLFVRLLIVKALSLTVLARSTSVDYTSPCEISEVSCTITITTSDGDRVIDLEPYQSQIGSHASADNR